MGDSIEILNDLDEVIRRKQQEIRERKQKEAEAKKLAGDHPDGDAPIQLPVNTEVHNTGDRMKLLNDLNDMIERKQREEKEAKQAKRQAKRPTRADTSRANGANSQGPVTPEGKQRASANSLKHGFFANVEKLNPQDAPVYQCLVHDLRHTLHPDNPIEELHIRELAMLSARLQRLEAAEYAILCSEIEAPPAPTSPQDSRDGSPERKGSAKTPSERDSVLRDQELDSRSMAAAFLNTQDALAHLHKIEVHLRRAYNRTWDRLRIMQKERRRISPEESRKRTHQWQSEENERTSGSSNPNPLADSRNFDDDFPPLPSAPPSTSPGSQEGGLPSPHGSPGSVTPKEPPSA